MPQRDDFSNHMLNPGHSGHHFVSMTPCPVLSISFEVDVPTGKGASFLGGLGECFPKNFGSIIKIETILTTFYVYYNRSFPQNLNHWLWRGRHSGTCESLGSSPVKMSQVFHDPSITSICFNFSYFHRKVNTFKTPEMCLNLDSDFLSRMFYNYFCGIFSLF